MDLRGATSRLLVGSCVLALLGGCSATPAPTPSVVVTTNLAYESANPVLIPGELDVHAPTKVGPWPVVVMFHGAPGSSPKTDRGSESQNARRVAELGFVVFNASWGHVPGAMPAVPGREWLQANNAQGACAVEFARSHAAEYGGDPSTLIVFGHGGGAHIATLAAFARPEPTTGCLGGTSLGAIDAVITGQGNWLFSANTPDWDAALAADPGVMDIATPWSFLADHRDQKVVMLVSEDSGAERKVGDPWAADSWLAVRDPSGDLRRQLEANGALADGTIGESDSAQLLYSLLKAQGNPVTLDVMGSQVFLEAFPKAAAKD